MKTQLRHHKTVGSLAAIISDLVHKAREDLEMLQQGSAKDALHDFRVCVRRLLLWLEICQECEMVNGAKGAKKQAKYLVKMTNGARDLEVRLAIFTQHLKISAENERPYIYKLKQKWEAKIARIYEELLEDVPKMFGKIDSALKKSLKGVEQATHGALTRDWVKPFLLDYASQLDGALEEIRSPADERAMHKARLLGKAFRYLLEPFALELSGGAALLKDLRRFQDLSGGLRDDRMLAEKLKDVMKRSSMSEDERIVLESARTSIEKETAYFFRELQSEYLSPSQSFSLKVKRLL